MKILRHTMQAIIPIVFLIFVWQITASLEFINTQLLPSPLNVANAFIDLFGTGSLISDIFASLQRVLIGFLFASVLGIGLGLLLGSNQKITPFFIPIIELLRPIPPIAWIPLAILWFGLGDAPAYFLVFLGAFFPIFTNTLFGVMAVEEIHKRVALSLGSNKKRFLTDILIPSSLPHIFAGLKIGLGVGWIVVITAELVGAQSGLGYMIQFNRLLLETPKIIVGMITIGAVGYLLNIAMTRLERKLIPWKGNNINNL